MKHESQSYAAGFLGGDKAAGIIVCEMSAQSFLVIFLAAAMSLFQTCRHKHASSEKQTDAKISVRTATTMN